MCFRATKTSYSWWRIKSQTAPITNHWYCSWVGVVFLRGYTSSHFNGSISAAPMTRRHLSGVVTLRGQRTRHAIWHYRNNYWLDLRRLVTCHTILIIHEQCYSTDLGRPCSSFGFPVVTARLVTRHVPGRVLLSFSPIVPCRWRMFSTLSFYYSSYVYALQSTGVHCCFLRFLHPCCSFYMSTWFWLRLWSPDATIRQCSAQSLESTSIRVC